MAFFGSKGDWMLNFCYLTPKRHILARNHVGWPFLRENRFRGLVCWPLDLKTRKRSRVNIFDAQFRTYWKKEALWGIVTKFSTWVDILDIITCATFGDDRLRGFGVTFGNGSNFPFPPLTCVVALTTLSHYRASVWWPLHCTTWHSGDVLQSNITLFFIFTVMAVYRIAPLAKP